MLKSFADVLMRVESLDPVRLAVAAAEDPDVMRAIKIAADRRIIFPILCGKASMIKTLAAESGLKDFEVIDQPDAKSAAEAAVKLTAEGRAKAVMKGLVNTSDFMRAVLNPQMGLRTGRRLSHLAALERPGEGRLTFLTDGAIAAAPDLEAKTEILHNALQVMTCLGYERPAVAALAANEQVNAKIQATVDAAALAEMMKTGVLADRCDLEGPIALDVAISPEAASHKKISSAVSGRVDLYLAPNLEAGNIFLKSLIYWGGASMAGLVAGASAPVVLTSRSDPSEGKLYSIALAVLAA